MRKKSNTLKLDAQPNQQPPTSKNHFMHTKNNTSREPPRRLLLCAPCILVVHPTIFWYSKNTLVSSSFYLFLSPFWLIHSFILLVSSRSFIFVRGKVHCVCFGQAESLMVVGVVVNNGGKLQLLFNIVFIFAYKT